jgi:hypothetical protein
VTTPLAVCGPTVLEEWRPCLGGTYSVSSLGRVRREAPGRNTAPGRLLHFGNRRSQYLVVCVRVGVGRRRILVHRLVAEAFLGPCPVGKEVNHRSGVKHDNRRENLEYVIPRQNIVHSYATGLHARPLGWIGPRPVGEKHGHAKLTSAIVASMRRERIAGAGLRSLGRKYGVDQSTARSAVLGLTWRGIP